MTDAIPLDEARRNGDSGGYRQTQRLHVIDPLHWAGQPIPERKWMVPGVAPFGSVTMLSGDGGLGKSLLTMQLAVSVATGKHWLGLEVMPVKVLCVYCEDDPDELHRRIADINKAYDISFGDLEHIQMISRVGMPNEFMRRDKYGKPQGPSDFFFQVLNAAKAFGAQLVILDGLHDLFDGNENSRPEARQFVNLLRRIALEIDGAVLLCAHPSLSGLTSGSGNSGSTAWNNAVRSRVYLTKPKDDDDGDLRVLRVMKSNYGKVGDEIKIKWRNGVFIPADAPDFVDRIEENSRGEGAGAAFLKCLDAISAQGRHVTDSKNSPKYGPKVFAGMPEAASFKVKALEDAMGRLFHSHAITIGQVGRNANGSPCRGIVRCIGDQGPAP
ncbi:MAG: AAA family ATPase [Alphaproteobacteria bacterium]|nr:AAA family ATPase [Alphaproteobacteria bacterium]